MIVPSRFKEKDPFGSLPGYLTDAGVIHPDSNTDPVYGYVWSAPLAEYILHAEFDVEDKKMKERDKENKERDKTTENKRRKTRRKV